MGNIQGACSLTDTIFVIHTPKKVLSSLEFTARLREDR